MHPEAEDLAALAADGDAPRGETAEHLRSCEPCRSEYEAFVAAAAAARASAGELDLETPPSSVWASIHDELGLDPVLAGDPLSPASASPESVSPASVSPASPSADLPASTTSAVDEPPLAPAVPIRRPEGRGGGGERRALRRWWAPIAAAAAVVGLVAGIAIGANLQDPSDAETVIAEARLEPFPGWDADGRALLEQDGNGSYSMLVELDGDVDVDGLTEVWLLREEPIGLVSLGLLDGRSTRFALPDGLDLSEFSIVDLSAEPSDGDPAHSGDSIVRGQLQQP